MSPQDIDHLKSAEYWLEETEKQLADLQAKYDKVYNEAELAWNSYKVATIERDEAREALKTLERLYNSAVLKSDLCEEFSCNEADFKLEEMCPPCRERNKRGLGDGVL